jgi:hypothetical protein
MDCEQLITATKNTIDLYHAIMENPSDFESARVAMIYDEVLRLHDSFVLCEPQPSEVGALGRVELWM